MTVRDWLKRRKVDRNLLLGAVLFALIFPYQMFAVLFCPALDELILDVLVAGALAVLASWIVYRWWRI